MLETGLRRLIEATCVPGAAKRDAKEVQGVRFGGVSIYTLIRCWSFHKVWATCFENRFPEPRFEVFCTVCLEPGAYNRVALPGRQGADQNETKLENDNRTRFLGTWLVEPTGHLRFWRSVWPWAAKRPARGGGRAPFVPNIFRRFPRPSGAAPDCPTIEGSWSSKNHVLKNRGSRALLLGT